MYATKYNPDLAYRFYDLCKQGYAIKEIAAEFMVHPNVLLQWANDDDKPEFKSAYEMGKIAIEAYYHKQARNNMTNPAFKDSLFKFYTGVLFKWSERSEQVVENKTPASDAELDQRIKQLEEKLKPSNVE